VAPAHEMGVDGERRGVLVRPTCTSQQKTRVVMHRKLLSLPSSIIQTLPLEDLC
jgi:hypothetical protein